MRLKTKYLALPTTAALKTKINKIKNKIPNITNLATTTTATTTTALTTVENKIPEDSKYITPPELHKLTSQSFASKIAQANLASKNDIANFVKNTDFDGKLKKLNKQIISNKTKHVHVENWIKKLQAFDASLFTGQSYFNND